MDEALDIPQEFGVPSIGEQFAFLRLSSNRSLKQLSGSADELVKNIADILNQMILRAIEKKTAPDFIAVRRELFDNYALAMRAMSDLARIVIPHDVLERLATESSSELEADFREHGESAFGSDVRDQAIFTVWTFRKISALFPRISSCPVPEDVKPADRELASKFAFYTLWTRFHLDCLTTSLHCHKPIYPEVRDVIKDGLRGAVNAYAWISQGVELRRPRVEPVVAPIEWDEEDQELLDSSMRELSREPIQ